VWSRRHDSRQHAARVASVYATVKQFNAVSYRVIATVVRQSDLSIAERANIIERWISIAQVGFKILFCRCDVMVGDVQGDKSVTGLCC